MDRVVRLPPGPAAALLLVLALACAAGSAAPAPLAPPAVAVAAASCEFDNVERIVAIGDVHGAYDRMLAILRAASVIDAKNKWIGGRTRLVQTGDVLDRGPDSRKALEFLRRLTREANSAGGAVHALIGNHEAMRLMADYRYVVPGEYSAFVNSDSEQIRRQALENVPAEQREAIAKETPLGMVEMLRAFRADQDLGRYVRGLDAVVKINGVVFLHGGISPDVSAMSCSAINDAIRRELGRDMSKTKENPTEALATREDGPLWYRGLATEPETFEPEVDKILAAQGATAFVLGHTADPGPIRSRFHKRVFLIDTGMQPAYLPDGRAAALEIKAGVFTAIYLDKREVIAGGEGR